MGAKGDAPGIPPEPGVFHRCFTGGGAVCLSKAADAINDALWIGAEVFVPATDRDALVPMRDRLTAGRAEQTLVFFGADAGPGLGLFPLLFLVARVEEKQGRDERAGHDRLVQENRVSTPVKPYNRL